MSASAQIIALVNPVDGREEEFRTWYWETHLPEVLALPGFISAQRLKTDTVPGMTTSHAYATVYTVDGSAAAALGAMFTSGLGMSDSLDLASMVILPLSPIGEALVP